MPKRKTPEIKPEEQFKRFVETADKLGVDDNSDQIAASFRKIAAPKKKAAKTAR